MSERYDEEWKRILENREKLTGCGRCGIIHSTAFVRVHEYGKWQDYCPLCLIKNLIENSTMTNDSTLGEGTKIWYKGEDY